MKKFNEFYIIIIIIIKLYEFIGGDKNRLSRKALYDLFKESLIHGKDGAINNISEKSLNEEIDEILKFVNLENSDQDFISLNDFVNILLSWILNIYWINIWILNLFIYFLLYF